MTPTGLTRSILLALGGLADQVQLFPVRAAEVAAWVAGGGVSTTLLGVVESRPFFSSEGDTGMSGETVVFKTDATTAAAIETPRRHALGHADRLYDVMRAVPDYPGGVDFYLQEYR